MLMLNRHLIIVIISFLAVAMIYGSSSQFKVFAVPPDENFGEAGGDCKYDAKTHKTTCCWRERVPGQYLAKEYCQTCDGSRDFKVCEPKQPKSMITLPPSALEHEYGEVLEPLPSTPQRGNDANVPLEGGILEQQEQPSISPQPSKQGGLLGLLEEATPPSDQSRVPTKGGLLGLLNEESNILQPSLPEFTTPQRNIPNTDLLSNLDDNNLLTNVPPKEDSTEPLKLLEEGQEEQQESLVRETDSNDNDENILKDDDKEEETEGEKEEQDNDDHIYCIRAPCPNSNSNDEKEQLSLNQDEDDETQSGEDEKQEQEELKEAELPPIMTETLTPE